MAEESDTETDQESVQLSTPQRSTSTEESGTESDVQVENAFKRQWELFLRHVVKDEPFRWDLLEGAKGVQLAEKGLESWKKRCWMDVQPLKRENAEMN